MFDHAIFALGAFFVAIAAVKLVVALIARHRDREEENA